MMSPLARLLPVTCKSIDYLIMINHEKQVLAEYISFILLIKTVHFVLKESVNIGSKSPLQPLSSAALAARMTGVPEESWE